MVLRTVPVDERCDTGCPRWKAGECDDICILADYPSDPQRMGPAERAFWRELQDDEQA